MPQTQTQNTDDSPGNLPVLSEVIFGNRLYFVDAKDPQRIDCNANRCDALVFAELPSGNTDAIITPLVNVWVDPDGNIHAASILKMQIEYSKLLDRRYGSRFSPERPYYVKDVASTGILDRNTLQIPYVKLQWRYDSLMAKYKASCRDATFQKDGSECYGNTDFMRILRKNILAAEAPLRDLRIEIDEFPLRPPKRVDVSRYLAVPYGIAGLPLPPVGSIPEQIPVIGESANPLFFSPVNAKFLKSAEQKATTAIVFAEQLSELADVYAADSERRARTGPPPH